MRVPFILLLSVLVLYSSHAVERCGTSASGTKDREASEAAQGFRQRQESSTTSQVIPVCFHVPQLERDLLRPITNEDLQNELNHLNQAFTKSSCCDPTFSWCSENNCSAVDAGISFAMATVSDKRFRHRADLTVTGTTNSTSDPRACISRPRNKDRFSLWYRSRSSKWSQDNNHRSMKAKYRVGNQRVLNVYYVYPLTFNGYEIYGYATFPWKYAENPVLDGLVLHTESLRGGSFENYNEGDTLVHETGHWLGLFHTFENGCGAGDLVDDTEPERIPNQGCNPSLQRNTCRGGGLDPIFNFMDYSSDACMFEFTQGQVERMLDNIAAYRTPK